MPKLRYWCSNPKKYDRTLTFLKRFIASISFFHCKFEARSQLFFKNLNYRNMKRLFILLFFISFYSNLFSQITILRQNYTVSGVIQDTTKYKAITIVDLSIPQRGANRIWDYTTIKDSVGDFANVNTPATVAKLPTEFKDATFVSSPRPTFGTYSIVDTQYRKLDTTGLFILGYKRGSLPVNISAQTKGATDSLFILSRLNRYTKPPFLLKFPMTSTTLSKVLTIDTLPYQLSWASAGYTKADVKYIRRAEYTTEVLGWGTLKLRNPIAGGPALNYGVLFERYAELRQDSFYLNGAPMPKRVLDTFRLIQGKRDTASMIYSMRGLGVKRGILVFNMSNDEVFIESANRVAEAIPVGVRDLASFDVPLSVFPNPTTEGVNLEFEKKTNGVWQAVIYNEVGQIIDIQAIDAAQGKITRRLTLEKSLPSGTYFINVLDETSLIRSNGRFVKM